MKLSKAIEIIQLNIKEAGRQMPPDVLTALKIHVEAAYCVQHMRSRGAVGPIGLLPSETTE